MDMIRFFTQALPATATSPYALVAYAVVVAAWLVYVWLTARPQKKAKEILDGVKDDNKKIELIAQLMGTRPPSNLARKDILEWVRLQSKEKNKVYLLIAYLATLAALVVMVVVALARGPAPSNPSNVKAQLVSIAGGTDPLPLPASARLVVQVGRAEPESFRINNCQAEIPVRPEWRRDMRARLKLSEAGIWVLAQPETKYRLDQGNWTVEVKASSNVPRLLIQVFNYAGAEASAETHQAFQQFQTIIRNKIQILSEALASRNASCRYVADLSVVHTQREIAPSPSEALEQWRGMNALAFLSGMLFRKDTALYVRSQPFLGQLAGPLLASQVHLDLKIDENEFIQMVDSHSLAVLYALAMDARQMRLPNDVVFTYLGEAVSVARGIDASLSGIAHLKSAIKEAFRQMGAREPEDL